MVDSTLTASPAASAPSAAGERQRPGLEDLSGRDRIAWNVLTSWGAYLIEVAIGFLVPRMLDRQIGQTSLGVWDFAWSCVSYFKLANIGIAQATGRYLARHRARQDVEGVNRVASSTVALSTGIALLVLVLTALAVWVVPVLFSTRLGEHAVTAQQVLALLGCGLAFNYLCEVFSGILTGSHRWDLHNALNAGAHAATAAAMIATLSLGGGLVGIALAHTGGIVLGELARMVVAYRVCPSLRIRASYCSLEQARQLLGFGAKASVSAIAWLILAQTNNLILVAQLGPAALALYARPNALLRIPDNLTRKLAFVITPIASSLQGSGRREEIRDLVIKGARSAAALALPMTLGLCILGGPLLHVWMGPRYDQGLVLTILTLGITPVLVQRPAMAVLVGLNLHGFIARVSVLIAALGVALTVLNVRILELGLVGAALAMMIPLVLTHLFIIPAFICRRLGLQMSEYLRHTYGRPLACAVPFGLSLLASRLAFSDRPLLALIYGSLAGGFVLALLYWYFLAPEQIRSLVLKRLREWLARGHRTSAS